MTIEEVRKLLKVTKESHPYLFGTNPWGKLTDKELRISLRTIMKSNASSDLRWLARKIAYTFAGLKPIPTPFHKGYKIEVYIDDGDKSIFVEGYKKDAVFDWGLHKEYESVKDMARSIVVRARHFKVY